MKRSIYSHPKALSDLVELAVHIGRDDPSAALGFLDAAQATMKRLLASPRLGRSRNFERITLAGLRSFPIKGYEKHLIFYRPAERGIEVLRVIHGARDLGAQFFE